MFSNVFRWLAWSDPMPAPFTVMSYHHLSEKERYVLSHLQYGFSQREIARRLGRSHTTISREFQRAKARHPWTTYHYSWAHPLALEKRQKPRHCKRQNNVRLVAYVETKIKQEWSPDEIANRLRIDFPDDEQMRISHETIYRWIYLDHLVDGTLYLELRRKHKKRRKQRRYGKGKRFKDDRVGIDQRPEIVDTRSRFGDWEGRHGSGQTRDGMHRNPGRKEKPLSVSHEIGRQEGGNPDNQMHKILWPNPPTDAPDLDPGQWERIRKFQRTGKANRVEHFFCRPLLGLATRSQRELQRFTETIFSQRNELQAH